MFQNWNLYTLVFTLIASMAVAFASLHCVHMLQLESYQGNMYRKWIKRAGMNEVISCLLIGFIALVLHLGWWFLFHTQPVLARVLEYGADAVYVVGLAYIGLTAKRREAKKPLAFTGRIWRLLTALVILAVLFHISFFLQLSANKLGNVLVMLGLRYLPGLLLPFFVLLAYYITLPLENGIKQWYFNDGKRKLAARKDIIKIGITGSYGKTSTKFILGGLLQETMETLITPGSYNTPMGVTRVIREQLKPEHTAFVAEMGARYKGDITELCNLVQPTIGIITSLGKQHLDTFGSYENAIETKSELIAALPPDGAAFYNGDNEDCRIMCDTFDMKNSFLFGIEGEGLYMRARDISVGKRGSAFTLEAADGASVSCETVLLGKHNICNIAGAAAVAYYLGVPLEAIAAGLAKLTPVEHRLQLIEGAVTVIDDAFNANPAGTKAALEVLAAFAPDKRIIITPGMIELGREQDALNAEFGRNIAHAADLAILVGGKRVEPIRSGLLEEGFDEASIVQVSSLSEASEKLPMYTSPGCVVLFENDLPDNYDEA